MEHNNGKGSSIIDEEESPDNDKIVAHSSSSSCSSSSCSNRFEVDISDLESPSMMITLPLVYDVNTLYGSPKQSPPVQVMSPSPLFGLKHRSNSEWSLASNESLFSIHTGNNSFSLDGGGFLVSKSGEFNWMDDCSCLTPDANKLPTVMDTSAENERKSGSCSDSESGEKDDVVETLNVSPVANSANISCLSDASCQSTSSFAFPVLAGGSPRPSPSPTKVEAEKPEPAPSTPPAEAPQTTPKAPPTIPKAGGNQWFHCFSCFPMCC